MKGLMCINQLSIDWEGYVYDCDFNQMLNMNIHVIPHKFPEIAH